VGAILGEVNSELRDAMAAYGMELGIAFQLMDDTLDYTASEEQFGKSIGHDLEEGKITLPLIHTLEKCNAAERDLIASVVEKDLLSDEDFARVYELVHRYGGIEHTVAAACQHVVLCKQQLEKFPPSAARAALADLADYVVTRVK
jgi:octaprenyl-diphosphate synthase